MAKKKKDKGPALTGGDILIAVLLSLIGGIGAFLVILVAGSILAPDLGKTADQPPAVSQPIRGTLPSSAPTVAPTPDPTEPPVEPSDEPSNEPIPEAHQAGHNANGGPLSGSCARSDASHGTCPN